MGTLKTPKQPLFDDNGGHERNGPVAKLRNNETLLEDIVNTLPYGVYRIRIKAHHPFATAESINFSIDFLSDRFCEILQCSRDELKKDPFLIMRLVHPDEYAAFIDENNKADVALTRFVWEGNMVLKQGTITVRFESIPRIEENGDKVWTGFLSDITERKRAEEALRLSEDKFYKAFKTSPDAIAINRISDGRYIEINDGFTTITGFTFEDVAGRSSLPGDLGIWVQKEERDRMTEGLTAHGEVIGHEAQFRMKNGQVLIGSMSARIVEINGEKCILSTTRDISERKRSEHALLASEAKYRELADTVPVGIFECDLEGKLTFANAILFTWFGYSESEFNMGMNVVQFIAPKDRERVRKNLARLISSPQLSPNEYTALRKDGSTFQIMSISTLLRENGKPTGFRGIHLDLTDKKKLEIVLQNTARLESLGVLAGGIAHDFNNLLTGIFGFIDLAKLESKDEKVMAYLSNAVGSISRARGLTLQLLTFAKGGAPVKQTGPLFPFVVETAQFALSGAVVSCRFEVPANLRHSDFDRNQIGQVIDNIIINAKQAMPMGGEISVTARNVTLPENGHPTLDPGDYVLIAIKDRGIGMPKEILNRIFDPFFTTKSEGHGLGLATSYSIVKRHGGCIEVESEPGVGSTFSLYLPATSGLPGPSTEKAPSVIHKGSGVFLVMDDEEVIRKTVAAMLSTLGYSVVLKREGKETVEYFSAELKAGRPIEGLFLDLTVAGGMGGKETVRHLRAIDPDVPVFVASGYADDPVMANPREFGFTASIRKPFTMGELATLLDNYMPRIKKLSP